MLGNPFLGYQIAGSFSFAALFCYLSTVAYFLPDVFDVQTPQFGVAFALTVLGFMTGSLINARVVVRFGLDATLRTGLLISLFTSCAIAALAPSAGQWLVLMAGLSSSFLSGVNRSKCLRALFYFYVARQRRRRSAVSPRNTRCRNRRRRVHSIAAD